MTGPARIALFGCPLDPLSPDEVMERARFALSGAARLRIEGLNVAKLVEARRGGALRQALEAAEIVHVDGAGITLGLVWLGIPAPPRRAGIDLMGDLCGEAARHDAGVYLLGGRADVTARAAGRLMAERPDLRIVGWRDGYFDAAEAAEVAAAVRGSGAALLFIGISSPKKELFLHDHWENLGVAVAMGVGGAFDVVAGALPRAPRLLQRAGLEWLFRLLLEPRRLAWRYLRTNTVYLGLLLGAWFGRSAVRLRGRNDGSRQDA